MGMAFDMGSFMVGISWEECRLCVGWVGVGNAGGEVGAEVGRGLIEGEAVEGGVSGDATAGGVDVAACAPTSSFCDGV